MVKKVFLFGQISDFLPTVTSELHSLKAIICTALFWIIILHYHKQAEHPLREGEHICRKRKYLVHSEPNVWFFQENGPLLHQPRKIFAMSCQLCLLCGACEQKRVIVIHTTRQSIKIYWQFCTAGGRSGAHGGCLGGGGQGLLCANDPGSNSHLVFIPLHF